MRCKNCGWENPDGLTRCEKCGTSLEGVVNCAESLAGTARENGGYAQQATPLNKTVCESDAFPNAAPVSENVCPQCGYPMRPGVTICPNCHYGATEQESPQSFKQSVQKQIKNDPVQGTVNPWVQVAPTNKCCLDPIPQEGVENPAALHFKGDAHELNRENLDPENKTITSKVQAELCCEDGQWFICDKSNQHTTFVYAGKKTALSDGDVILMGNRQFVFKVEK